MCVRVLSCLLLVLVLTGCPSSTATSPPEVQECSFVIEPEVDGVQVASPDGVMKSTVAGEPLMFSLACAAQPFRFEKSCYPPQQVTLQPGSAARHQLLKADWEYFGYFRLENGSASSVIEARNLPGGVLRVPSTEHAVRTVPLGDYSVEVTAAFKEPVQRYIRVCAKDDIFSLRVNTNGPDGELVTESAQELVLEHGTGELLVVTEDRNVVFTITPDRSEKLRGYLKTIGATKIADIDLEKAPVGIRQALTLLQRLGSESFRAPASITLPAGRYFLEYNLQREGTERLEVEVLPGRETKMEL